MKIWAGMNTYDIMHFVCVCACVCVCVCVYWVFTDVYQSDKIIYVWGPTFKRHHPKDVTGHIPPCVFLVRTVFGEATAATFSENVGREWQRQGGSTGKARHTHGVSTWPARHAWPRAVACIVRCARGKCVVRAYNVLTTCLQRTVSVRLPRYLTEAVLTRAAHVRCPYSLARCKCVHVRRTWWVGVCRSI